jgi:hypothetical protein
MGIVLPSQIDTSHTHPPHSSSSSPPKHVFVQTIALRPDHPLLVKRHPRVVEQTWVRVHHLRARPRREDGHPPDPPPGSHPQRRPAVRVPEPGVARTRAFAWGRRRRERVVCAQRRRAQLVHTRRRHTRAAGAHVQEHPVR